MEDGVRGADDAQITKRKIELVIPFANINRFGLDNELLAKDDAIVMHPNE